MADTMTGRGGTRGLLLACALLAASAAGLSHPAGAQDAHGPDRRVDRHGPGEAGPARPGAGGGQRAGNLPPDRGSDRAGQDRGGQDRTHQDRTHQDRTHQGWDREGRYGQDRGWPDRGQDARAGDRRAQDWQGHGWQERRGPDRWNGPGGDAPPYAGVPFAPWQDDVVQDEPPGAPPGYDAPWDPGDAGPVPDDEP